MLQQTVLAAGEQHKQLMSVRSKVCDVRYCASNSLRNPEMLFVGVPSHRFPERRFVWLTLMQPIRDKKRSYVCSRHFKIPDDFKDFNEFISAPPGYKRQLLVKKGVVPHINMPLNNNTGLPPLVSDRWHMTLPVTLTESHKIKQAAAAIAAMAASGRSHPPSTSETSVRQPVPSQILPQRLTCMPSTSNANNGRKKISKAIQTDAKSTIICGRRSVRPSLQYCRLCLKRQDLEPIFAGDQTLIEPDLIDKIYGNFGIMITAQCDFPSSICSGCYKSIYDFVNFRELVRKNDRSLWMSTGSQMEADPVNPPPVKTLTSVRKKTTELKQPIFRMHNAAAVSKNVPNTTLQQNGCHEDSLLMVGRVEDIRTYEQRQKILERNQPRDQRIQDTLIPIPYRRKPMIDPLENIDETTDRSVVADTPVNGVQMGDRIVPVTFIEVSPDIEINVPKLEDAEQPEKTDGKQKDNELETNESSQHTKTANNTEPPTDVLQAVRLISKSALEAAAQQRNAPGIAGPQSTNVNDDTASRILKVSQSDQKKISGEPKPLPTRIVPRVTRGIKLPGTLTTQFSGNKKKASKQWLPVADASKMKVYVKLTKTLDVLKSIGSPQLFKTTNVKALEKNPTNSVQQKLKENDIPAKDTPATSPRTIRARKIPLKYKDTVGFPMPKIIIVKPDPDDQVKPSQLVTVTPKPKSSSSRMSEVVSEDKTPQVVEEAAKARKVIPKEHIASDDKKPRGRPRIHDPPVKDPPKPPAKPVGRPPKRKSDSMASHVAIDPTEKISSKLPKVEKATKDSKQASQRQQNVKANGSRKSAPEKDSKGTFKETPPATVVSSQDWKCPFCSDKIYVEKKDLVRHLRRRHGMDYAVARQRLAIYGGNWR